MFKRILGTILGVLLCSSAFAGLVVNPVTGKLDNAGPWKEGATSISTTKNVGIGTAVPTTNLEVVGAAKVLSLTATGTGNVGIGSVSPSALLDVNGTVRMVGPVSIPGTGNVGIGSVSPVAQLDVVGGARIGSVRWITGAVVTNSTNALTLTGANMAKNSIFQETGTTAATFTLDTGTNLSSAVPGVQVGDMVQFIVSNASNQTITMAGATGTTMANAVTVATLTSRTFYAINTGSNTWTIY